MNFTNISMKSSACFPVSSDGACSYQAVNPSSADSVDQKVGESWRSGWEQSDENVKLTPASSCPVWPRSSATFKHV